MGFSLLIIYADMNNETFKNTVFKERHSKTII